MLQTTRAVVLRSVAYGDSSLIVSAFTERFGLQQYMVKGARKAGKKTAPLALMLQPAAILEMVVYHHPTRQLQMIREARWSIVYSGLMGSITRHTIALYMVELLHHCLRQPEPHETLFEFVSSNLLMLDQCDGPVMANLPLYFTLKLAGWMGFLPEGQFSESRPYLDLREGVFCAEPPVHGMYLDEAMSKITQVILEQENPVTLYRIKLNHLQRRALLNDYIRFYQYHFNEFGKLKTLPVLQEVLGA